MGLMESIDKSIRGITLTSQEIDLFNIIQNSKSQDQAEEIYKYLKGILKVRELTRNPDLVNPDSDTLQKMIKTVELEKLGLKSEKDKATFKQLLKSSDLNKMRAYMDSRDRLEKFFQGKGVDNIYIDAVLNLKKFLNNEQDKILTFLVNNDGQTIDIDGTDISSINIKKTAQKVQALYEHITGKLENGEKRFTRLTLDGQGKFGTVAGGIDTKKEAEAMPEDYNLEPLKQGYEFARKNEMKEVYINALVFFKDFQDRLVGGTKEQYETALINYGKVIASIAKEYEKRGISTVIDIFNEFVDYSEPFNQKTNGWMSKLSIEDLCKIAVELKKEMPNVDFGYNDWNFENPDKRAAIFEVIRKIQQYEKNNGCKILNHIGTQCHTSVNDLEGLIESINELKQFGLPIDITELDISIGLENVDYEKATEDELKAIKKYEQKLQIDIMRALSNFANEGKSSLENEGYVRAITAWSSTDELCPDFCNGEQASIIGMSYDEKKGFAFFGKDIDKVIEMSEYEMQLIRNHQEETKKRNEEKIIENPVQDFCYHTHTERCGHADKDTGDKEYIESAIKGGLKKIAFTDHVPLPDGYNKKANTRMDIGEVDSYLSAIEHFKKKYKDKIEIESGFEFEYSDRDLKHLQELRSKADKMILGQHFVIDKEGKEIEIKRGKQQEAISDDTLILYGESIVKAINTNYNGKPLPDVIAHPDLFMKCRNNLGDLEKRITCAICDAAITQGIPLEINFGEIAKYADVKKSSSDIKSNISYPSPAFWEFVAQEYGEKIKVIFGKDAHTPSQLSIDKDYEIAIEVLGTQTLEKLKFVKSDLKTVDEGILDRSKREDGPSGAASGVHSISTQSLGKETLPEQTDTFSKDDTEKDMEAQMRINTRQQQAEYGVK
ncbi:MAG: endo-1,4-beta-xylanase [Clostridia bacterium]|nr:endo-1,4-beta-xylanase [Clostridia bacterium]